MSGGVQSLNREAVKMLKGQLKIVLRLTDTFMLRHTDNPDIARVYNDLVAVRVSIRTALRNLRSSF